MAHGSRTSLKRIQMVFVIAISVVLLAASIFTQPTSAAVNSYSYVFEPSEHYTNADYRVNFRIYTPVGILNPSRVDWFDPLGHQVGPCPYTNTSIVPEGSCVTAQSFYAPNGYLSSRVFYFYIAGNQRITGTYRADAYNMGAYYQETFIGSANFYIDAPAPTLTDFSPASAARGKLVTITGTGFDGATGVTFGGTPAETYTIDSSTQITAKVGAGSSGIVSVLTPTGSATSSANFVFMFSTYLPMTTK
jgi:hypothetical protein